MPTSSLLDFWKRKLAAFLHDPPHKPFRIAGHEDARKSFWAEVGLSQADFYELFERPDDHWAAAADRMIFSDAAKSGVSTDWKADTDCAFHHPLGNSRLTAETIQRSAAVAEKQLHEAQQRAGVKEEDSWETRFWKTWRIWPENAARKHPLLAYLAADTRVPNHTLWHHNGMVSALNGCGEDCAFLLFQIGPVQDFIQQARTTRDLWAGSYLLSYLIAKGMFALAQAIGPDAVVYPQLRGVPLMDWFGHCEGAQYWKDEMRASHRSELLTPNLPNRFLAVVPSTGKAPDGQCLTALVSKAIRDAWQEITTSVHEAIATRMKAEFPQWDIYWQEQTDRFPVIDCVLHKWADTEQVLKDAENKTPPLHDGWEKHPLKKAIEWATQKIDPKHFDARCYYSKSWKEGEAWRSQLLTPEGKNLADGAPPFIKNKGFYWALHYAATEWRFAAVKSARATASWTSLKNLNDPQRKVEKDHLDGRNEVLGGEDHNAFWLAMRNATWGGDDAAKGATLFKDSQEYGALTTLKRLYPHVWMKQALDTQVPRFESVQDIAEADEKKRDLYKLFDAIDAKDELPKGPKYYAILAMDGDSMGEWVSGSRTPPWKDILSGDASDAKTPLGYFAKQWGTGWQDVRSPLTPSFHAALSEALGNFSLYCAGQIVEAFGGQLIYAGGDDVLAMLPAAKAVDCAIALQFVFRGQDPAQNSAPEVVQKAIAPLFDFPAEGFIQCKQGVGKGDHCRPNWPLMVMGPKATASVGIAIGHVRSPMQDIIQAARDAEAIAKKVKQTQADGTIKEKGALCLRVLKRSGESVQFATRFDSGALNVWVELEAYRQQQSGRFIYRFLQKLKPLLVTVHEGQPGWEKGWQKGDLNLLELAQAELAHTLQKQTEHSALEAKKTAEDWLSKLASLAPADFLHLWMARAFLNRLTPSGEDTEA